MEISMVMVTAITLIQNQAVQNMTGNVICQAHLFISSFTNRVFLHKWKLSTHCQNDYQLGNFLDTNKEKKSLIGVICFCSIYIALYIRIYIYIKQAQLSLDKQFKVYLGICYFLFICFIGVENMFLSCNQKQKRKSLILETKTKSINPRNKNEIKYLMPDTMYTYLDSLRTSCNRKPK